MELSWAIADAHERYARQWNGDAWHAQAARRIVMLGWTLEEGLTFDSLAQSQLAVVNEAIALQEGLFQIAQLPVSGALSFDLSAENGGQAKLTARVTLPTASFRSLPGLSPEGQGSRWRCRSPFRTTSA